MEALISKLGVTLKDSEIEGLLGMKMVNMNYYPACPNPELTVGVGRHSDVGAITVLLQDGIGGLYVKVDQQNRADKGEWLEIPPIPGALVINIGDTLQVWYPKISTKEIIIRTVDDVIYTVFLMWFVYAN